jgi:TatD DNase family protein
MDLIDSHAHVDVSDFDADRDTMFERARAAGVGTILAIGNGPELENLGAALAYAESYDWIYAAAGIHPHEAQHATEAHYAELNRLAESPRLIAWGEIGLDYHYDHSPREVQREAFLEQMLIAGEARKPIVIHTREAWEDTIALLEVYWRPYGLGGIMHCFSGGPDQAALCLDLGFHLSFAGILTFPKSTDIQEAARRAPPDRILIETDAPYLAPVPYRGKRNEPAFVAQTARKLAELRGVTPEEIARITTENFLGLCKA